MVTFIDWVKANPSASLTMMLLVCSTVIALWQAKTAKNQAETAERGLAIAERAAMAAEHQLDDARAATIAAQQEREVATQRAIVADEQAKLAHEQMKSALAPQLVMLRIQDRNFGQKFFIENQGSGFALEITWDYIPPLKPPNSGRLVQGFSSNALAPSSRQEFMFSYDRFQQTGIMFRYSSRDGRIFWTHVSLADAFGGFRHVHFLDTD